MDSPGNVEWNQLYSNDKYPLSGLTHVNQNCIIEVRDGSLVVAGLGLEGGGFFEGEYFMVNCNRFCRRPHRRLRSCQRSQFL